MRIRTRRRIWQQETDLFVSANGQTESGRIFLWKLQRKRARGEKKKSGLRHQRAPLSPFRMLFMLLTGLLTSRSSFCEVSLGAHFGFGGLWSLHSSSCIIYEGCDCYSESLIEIVDTSSWNKNNEGTINLSAVNSHLSEQHVRFLWDPDDISDMFSCCTGPMVLASRPISHWISFHFEPQPNPHLLYQRHELRLNPQKVCFIFCHGSKSNVTEVCFWGINYVGLGRKHSLIQLFEIDLRKGLLNHKKYFAWNVE